MSIRKTTFLGMRIILAIIYLWVVADRLSLLGSAGNMGVVWGNFENFLAYTATLNPWFQRGVSDVLGYIVTFLEIVIAVILLSGIRLKEASLASFVLLIIFTLSMIFSVGFTVAYDFIIFTVILAFVSGILYREERAKR